MKKFLQKKLKDQKGMTLIELLAVIVIIAIIAAIAIPAISNIIENSRVGAMKSDALNSLSAASIYYADDATVDDNVTVEQLVTDGYLDDQGTLLDDASISKDGLLSGDAEVNDELSITFANASRNMINDVPNNSESGATGVTISRP